MIVNPGTSAEIKKGAISVRIVEIICENVTLDSNTPSITFQSEITLDPAGLYFLHLDYYFADGTFDADNGGSTFSRVETDSNGNSFVRWLSHDANNSVTLTRTGVTDTWHASDKKSVISIYKAEILIFDKVLATAMSLEGRGTIASGIQAHAEGRGTIASGIHAHAEGRGTSALGDYSHAEGRDTIASGRQAHAEGLNTSALGDCSHAEGGRWAPNDPGCIASSYAAHAEGCTTEAKSTASHAEGIYTIANWPAQVALGKANVESTSTTDKVIVGKGTSKTDRANCFRVTDIGVYAAGAHNSTGADYAELFEWADGNPEGEDRVGRFVTLEGEKVRLAGPQDGFVLGIVSGNPSVVGDVHDDQWAGMYLYDIFGRPLWEDVDVPAVTMEMSDPEAPEKTIPQVIVPAHTEHRQKINPDYDGSQPYQPRTQRPEWDAVGMLGKLVAVDDGSCQVNGWCTVGDGGVATRSDQRTRYRVMVRLDESHVRVLIL